MLPYPVVHGLCVHMIERTLYRLWVRCHSTTLFLKGVGFSQLIDDLNFIIMCPNQDISCTVEDLQFFPFQQKH